MKQLRDKRFANDAWLRRCQECGNVQVAKQPNPNKDLSDSYANSLCRKCKSESLDYGTINEYEDFDDD